jgi:hypothetical protein
MNANQDSSVAAICQCGKVVFRTSGPPILAASCYCNSCQQAGQAFESLPSVPPLRDADGSTPMVLYRKDRVHCEAGKEHLAETRLKPDSPTRRIIATCCNSPMYLEFTKGHWLSVYRKRIAIGAPPIEMRVMTKDRPADVALANDMPNYDTHSGKFMLKLLGAWVAMGFRRPDMGLKTISRFNG